MSYDFRGIGRLIGLLLLTQALLAIPVYTEFGMMGHVTSPDFLNRAAAHAVEIATAVVLTFVLSGLTIAVALLALPAVRQVSERLIWLFFGLSVAGLATTAVESVVVREMLTMSINYAKPGAPKELFETLAPVTRSEWSAAHFFNLALGHLKAHVFFWILYRTRFIPRVLAGLGIIATVASTAGITATLLGFQFSYFMIAPAGLIQLAMALWLILLGFKPLTATVTEPA